MNDYDPYDPFDPYDVFGVFERCYETHNEIEGEYSGRGVDWA